jgi:3-oxoacyl-(acyl-carrier-protein) synthase
MKNKVFITYYDCITAAGLSAWESINCILDGQPQLTIAEKSSKIHNPYFFNHKLISREKSRTLDIIYHLLDKLPDNKKMPLFYATSTGNINETEKNYKELVLKQSNYPLLKTHFFDYITTEVKNKYKNLINQSISFSTACSSSAHAVLQAARFIENNIIDEALILATDVISLTTAIGFDSLKLISPTGAKPLALSRNGLTLGEGGGVLILSKNQTSAAVAEITGYASNSDGYHISSPDPQGTAQNKCIQKSIAQSNIALEEIDYVNAHGTGTVMNDEVEVSVIKSIFTHKILMTSFKGFIGHTLGASAINEIALALEMLSRKKIIQLKNFTDPLDSAIIPTSTNAGSVKYFLKNSFGFGGNNVSLVIKLLN